MDIFSIEFVYHSPKLGYFIIAHVGYDEVMIICLASTGANRYNGKIVKIKNPTAITEKEFRELVGYKVDLDEIGKALHLGNLEGILC